MLPPKKENNLDEQCALNSKQYDLQCLKKQKKDKS